MIQAQKVHKALGWFPEIWRDTFCMCDLADHCLGGPCISEDVAAKSQEALVDLYSALLLEQSILLWQSCYCLA